MTVILIILLSLAGFAGLSILGGFIFYYAYGRKAAAPLSPRERKACRAIVKRHKGYPFVCALFVRDGVCGCRPCPMLERELGEKR